MRQEKGRRGEREEEGEGGRGREAEKKIEERRLRRQLI